MYQYVSGDRYNEWTEEYDTKEAALDMAEVTWNLMSRSEKQHHTRFYVAEVDGEEVVSIVKKWK